VKERSCQSVRKERENSAEDKDRREQDAVVAAEHHPPHMGTYEPDIGDGTAHGHYCSGDKGRDYVHAALDPPHFNAEYHRIRLTHADQIQAVGDEVEEKRSNQNQSGHRVDGRVHRPAEIADEPVEYSTQIRLIGAGEKKDVDDERKDARTMPARSSLLRSFSAPMRAGSNDKV